MVMMTITPTNALVRIFTIPLAITPMVVLLLLLSYPFWSSFFWVVIAVILVYL